MQVVLDVALPVCAIILAGFAAGKAGLLGEAASQAINQYVYWFALPAVLFIGLARTPLTEVLNLSFLGVFVGSTVLVYAIAFMIGRAGDKAGSGHYAQQALTASFPNTGYMGIPIFTATWGASKALPAIIGTVVVSAVMIAVAITAQEVIGSNGNFRTTVKDVARALSRNPLIASAVAGLAWTWLGLPLPTALGNFFTILGGSAGPCALFAIGLFLAGRPLECEWREVGWIIAMKLVVQPALAWLLITLWFPLDRFWMGAALLLAALPTGSLTFVVAQTYTVYVERTSQVILASTVLSIPLLAAILAAYG